MREDITLGTRRQVWRKTDGRCWYCGDQLEPFGGHPHLSFHVDHVAPVSKGGLTEVGNLVPSCENCNPSKRDMSLEQFRRLRAWQATYFESEVAGIRLVIDPFMFFGEKLEIERKAAAKAKAAQLSPPDPEAEAFDKAMKQLFRLLAR